MAIKPLTVANAIEPWGRTCPGMLLSRGGHGQRRRITSQGVLVRPKRKAYNGSRRKNHIPRRRNGWMGGLLATRCSRSAGSYCRLGHKPPRRLPARRSFSGGGSGTSSHRRVRAYSLGHKRVRRKQECESTTTEITDLRQLNTHATQFQEDPRKPNAERIFLHHDPKTHQNPEPRAP